MNQAAPSTAALPPKPLPIPSELAQPFWDALRHNELHLQRCDACGFFNHPPRICCPQCHGHALTWTKVEPRGTVYSYTIVHRPPVPAFKADVPYAAALVEITGTNAKLLSNLLAPLDQLRIGMPVEVVFDPVTQDMSLFRFRPLGAGATVESR